MANELSQQLDSSFAGATIVAKVKDADGTIVHSVTLSEESDYFFTGDLPSTDAGIYLVSFFNDSTLVGIGNLIWTGTREATIGDISEVRKALLNNMKVDPDTNQLIIYEDDGTTQFKVYNLYDKEGNSTDKNIFDIRLD